ncbi:MAG: flap endonuclease-1 [Conexivisphaerales archaeon]
MGVDLAPLVKQRTRITLDDLSGRVLAIDAYNSLYQFLTIIRGEGGEPLMDSRGNVTSHLSGLFYRTINMLEKGVRPLYVFDGKSPELKRKELVRREELKKNAREMYEVAVARGDTESARKFASMSAHLNAAMVQDAKSLLDAMGLPWVQAPSEGEAEASYLAMKGVAWATVSQDYDSLLFGAPRLIRNLAISGRRKLPGKNIYIDIHPEIVELMTILSTHSITREQLVDIGILLGTDFNPEGFRGIGAATALKFIKKYGRLEEIKELKDRLEQIDYNAIRKIFLSPDVKDIETPEWKQMNKDSVIHFLCDMHDFSRERVSAAIQRVLGVSRPASSTLEKWF